jgi:hypothetical protein
MRTFHDPTVFPFCAHTPRPPPAWGEKTLMVNYQSFPSEILSPFQFNIMLVVLSSITGEGKMTFT